MSEAIKVVVRVRPMNTKEKTRECLSIVKVDQQNNQISLQKPDENDNVKTFAFDSVFDQNSTQQSVYTKTAYNLVQNVLTGYNGTIFAYGQTGCGKTHSMVGKVQDQDLQGIIPRSFGHILKSISQTSDKQFLIRCSFIEIYNQEVRDLLAKDVKNKLEIKQSADKGVFIKDLSINQAKTHEQLMQYMNLGNKNRSVGQTAMNKDSSRSHLLFALYLESADLKQNQDQRKYIASKLNLVDLAGSQRISKTGVSGDRLKEAQKINLSLSALGNVISALVDGKSHHIPYRDSKLTRLLQDSLGGNTKTVMIANCSPADYNFDQTLSTLRYASRAKFIKNKPIINEDPKDALLKQYANQIKNLKMLLQQQNGDGFELKGLSDINQNSSQIDERLKKKQQELLNEKQEKRKLLQKINQLQNRHVEAKDIHIDNHLAEQIDRAKSEAKLEEQKKNNLKKKMLKTTQIDIQNLNGVQEAEKIQKYKSVTKKLKNRIKNLEQELKDINHQNYMDKQQNLEDIRILSKQNKLLQGIINILLLPNQLDTVRNQCEYSQESGEYHIPPFYLKNKQLIFPKLPQSQSMDMIRQMQDNRNLVFSQINNRDKYGKDRQAVQKDDNYRIGGTPIGAGSGKVLNGKQNQFSVKGIIKQARNENKVLIKEKQELKKMNRKVQLEPLKKQ